MPDTAAKPRVIIADDHALVLEGLVTLLAPEYDIVATAEDGPALLRSVDALRPDLVLLDISLPLLNGIEVARDIGDRFPETRIIMVTMHADATFVRQSFAAGASGYVVKRSASRELLSAISAVLAGGTYVTPLISPESPDGSPGVRAGSFGRLTHRQRQVLQQVAEGRSAREIAATLTISVKTVEFHKNGLMRSLGLHTTADLVRFAVKHGLVSA
jgi:DNA-binding NarL/FixJ family response regulator